MRTITALLLSAALAAGCSILAKPEAGKGEHGAARKGSGGKELARSASRILPEFGDVPVPAELKRDEDLSFVYEAPGVTMGVVTLSGYYKGAGIARFFRVEMPKREWQFLNAFTEGNHYMLNFLKAGRSCVIDIVERALTTRVTIKVGPTQGG